MKKFLQFGAMALCLVLGTGGVLANDKKDEAAYKKIEAQLESVKLDVFSFNEADIVDVVKDIGKRARITVVIEKAALESLDEDARKITLELADIKAGNALNIVLDQTGLYKSYKNGILYITTKERAESKTLTKTYDVRDITAKVVDFPAPEIRLRSEDNASGPQYVEPEKEEPTTEDIVEMIEESVDADWGGTCSVTIAKGNLIIRAPRSVHKEVAELLDMLRGAK